MGTLLGTTLGSPSFAAQNTKPQAAKRMRILVIGGTGFAGSHLVHAAAERGHDVTVFSRGEPVLPIPKPVTVIAGDRFKDLQSIPDRDWDAVIDFAAFSPLAVRSLGKALRGRVGHYTLISTVMTYAYDVGIIDENSAVLPQIDPVNPYAQQGPEGWYQYGSFKVLCEREAEKQFPESTLVVRPGVITGPGDRPKHLGYWLARMEQGGEVLAPGDPLDPAQFIDVRDLARWTLLMVEQGEKGIYNAVGPEMPLTMSELLGAIRSLFAQPLHLTWVPTSWLAKQNLRADEAPFFWVKNIPSTQRDEFWISYRVSSKKAEAKGLTYRRITETLLDSVTWFRQLPDEQQPTLKSGWPKIDEATLLAAWHESK
jgi:2'-hydroxyisoflavone reductase